MLQKKEIRQLICNNNQWTDFYTTEDGKFSFIQVKRPT